MVFLFEKRLWFQCSVSSWPHASVAHDTVKNFKNNREVFDAHDGLIQVVIDNFDDKVASQNSLAMVHNLAMIVCQSPNQPHA